MLKVRIHNRKVKRPKIINLKIFYTQNQQNFTEIMLYFCSNKISFYPLSVDHFGVIDLMLQTLYSWVANVCWVTLQTISYNPFLLQYIFYQYSIFFWQHFVNYMHFCYFCKQTLTSTHQCNRKQSVHNVVCILDDELNFWFWLSE